MKYIKDKVMKTYQYLLKNCCGPIKISHSSLSSFFFLLTFWLRTTAPFFSSWWLSTPKKKRFFLSLPFNRSQLPKFRQWFLSFFFLFLIRWRFCFRSVFRGWWLWWFPASIDKQVCFFLLSFDWVGFRCLQFNRSLLAYVLPWID